jgi:hypothetical protein
MRPSRGHAPAITDAALLELLIERGKLTADQMTAFVGYLTALASGQLERLPKLARDHALATARAAGLVPKVTEPPRRGPNLNVGDRYSEARSEGTVFAERLLTNLPKKPPAGGRRVA